MAEVFNVAVGDTITSIVASRKNPQCHEMQSWVDKIVRLNPHVADPDQIYPNEKILVPDSLQEHVPALDIWQNALRHVHRCPDIRRPSAVKSSGRT